MSASKEKQEKINNISIKELYERHYRGISISSLAKEVGMSSCWLGEQFAKHNLPMIKKEDVYEKQSKKIIELFLEGKIISEISKLLNIPNTGIWKVLQNHNIDTHKNPFFYREKIRKYTINEDYFNKIDCQEKAYILGFLYADGNANKKYYQITLKLQDIDKSILEQISALIETNKPLHFYKKQKKTHQNQSILKITNKVIYQDLIGHGIVPNKTFITKFPNIAEELIPHFIRGYFDGDGSLYEGKDSKTTSREWCIIGSTNFCKSIQKILKDILDIDTQLQHDKR